MSNTNLDVPRSEYPRPQFVREDWLCLNGEWQFEIDNDDTGLDQGLLERELSDRIQVPFCPESSLSGIGHTDFMNAVWYRRTVTIPTDWAGRDVLLHFQAVDYDATVWVNGQEMIRHRGGWCGFACDLAGLAEPGQEIIIVVRARDYVKQSKPSGKQSFKPENFGCFYTRTTGIWQSVWMEPAPRTRLERPRITPDVANSTIRLAQRVANPVAGIQLRVTLTDGEGEICKVIAQADGDLTPCVDLPVPPDRRRLWSPADPHLYDIEIELLDAAGKVVDRAASYAGLRSVTIDGKAIRINGEIIFQRLVLDQGYYPDGIMTAPNDAAPVSDIELSVAAGFNGARLHQKVFEERFLYYADKMGYLVWGEFGDWGKKKDSPYQTFITEWMEVLQRDYNHPSIIGWCPLNEADQPLQDEITAVDDLMRGMFLATKATDATRPVLDVSGFSHRVPESDIFDWHDYSQTVEEFRQSIEKKLKTDGPTDDIDRSHSIAYGGQPFFMSEFGGIWWNGEAAAAARDDDQEESWGYGERVRNIDEFYERFENLCNVLLDDPRMFGYCYTQLTDVFQEQNGLYDFDRQAKFDMERIRSVQTRQAAIEKEVG